MIKWLGIGHLFELSGSEAVWGFVTPLVIFAVFCLAQLILPARRVPGYVINPETGKPRNYRLNGLLVFVIAQIVWALELTGMPHDWFYRSSVYAVAGGTVLTAIFAIIAVFTQPKDETKNTLLELWEGRIRELSLFNNRFDVKMWFYVVGGTMLSLNALSGAVYHYERFGEDANPGVFLYAALFTLYVLDYFVFERTQLYTFDLIHENLGLQAVLGWARRLRVAVHPPAVGYGCAPGPRTLTTMEVCLAHRGSGPVPGWLVHRAQRHHAEVHI